jgi:hypothetical protein
MSFRTLAVFTAIVTFLLGVGYLFAGATVVGRWQIEPTESVLLLGRRIGALYLGLSVIYFLARAVPASASRTALCAGTALTCCVLVVLGIYEFSAGRIGSGIFVSVAIEAFLALGYIWLLLTGRKATAAISTPDDATNRLR